MFTVLIIVSGICFSVGVLCLVQDRRMRTAAEEAYRAAARAEEDGPSVALPIPPWMQKAIRVALPIAERLTTEDEKKRLVLLLQQSGHPFGMGLNDLLGFRILCAVCGVVAGGLFSGVWWMIGGGVAGYLGVTYWLKSVAGGREAQIRADLPDFLDAVSISLKAGVPIEHVLALVTDHFTGPLHDEFARFLDEVKLGFPRTMALRKMIERTSCRELELLLLALIQGLQLGVPLSETFMVQAKSLRSSRAQRAKQLAGKATPKITMVSTLLVTPSVLALIIGILVLNFMLNPDLMGFQEFLN